MSDIRSMQIGQLVDFVVDYNNRMKRAEKERDKPKKRKATKADFQRYFGG